MISLLGTDPGEIDHYMFERRIPGRLVNPIGLMMAKDFDKKVYCSSALISSDKLSDKEAEKILRSRAVFEKWRLVIRDKP